MNNSLIEINDLINKDHLWSHENTKTFNYSDGEGPEIFLRKIVSEAKDLSSRSVELEASYSGWDWVSEYHLSSMRANILRGIDFSRMSRVLEIGAGCGAITRFIGEQGLEVDAIEGALTRAQIAKLRCRDLDNVNIINTNFNDIVLPDNTYDAIFIVGVIEYAAKFLDGVINNEDAVVAIIEKLRNALTDDGVMVIAIENRNGLKYWLGASEDHFAKPYVGLADYWGYDGVRTYSLGEWKNLLQRANIPAYHFQFPFPDYKLSQVILDQNFIDSDAYAFNLLYRIHSRDYLKPWHPGGNEFPIWRSLHGEGRLKEFSNSFLIFTGQSKSDIEKIAPADFVYFSGTSRKPEYRTVTIKPRNDNNISKTTLNTVSPVSSSGLTHREINSPYVKGHLLSTLWIESIVDGSDHRFIQHLSQYKRFIDGYLGKNMNIDLVDALPMNIVVDHEGRFHLFDHEWNREEQVTAGYILFRALFYFGIENRYLLEPFFNRHEICTLEDFVAFGLSKFGIELDIFIDEFIRHEEEIQFKVGVQMNLSPVRGMLKESVKNEVGRTLWTSLMWATDDSGFEMINSQELTWHSDRKDKKLQFCFFSEKPVVQLRVKPLHTGGFFSIQKIRVCFSGEGSDSSTVLFQAESERLLTISKIEEGILVFTNPSGVCYAQSGDAAIKFDLEAIGEPVTSPGFYECTLWMGNTDRMASGWSEEAVENEKRKFESRLKNSFDRLKEKDEYISHLKEKNEHLEYLLAEKEKWENESTQVKTELSRMTHVMEHMRELAVLRYLGTIFPRKYGWLLKSLKNIKSQSDIYERIVRSGLFDDAFYKSQEPDLTDYNDDGLRHYLEVGAAHGTNPHCLFDTRFYLSQLKVLDGLQINPLFHYLSAGWREGKDPSFLFSSRFYLEKNSDVAEAGLNPLVHYIQEGAKNGCNPHPLFNTRVYLELYPDARECPVTPLEHFMRKYEKEELSPTPLFDTGYYLKNRPDVKRAGVPAFYHYMMYGYREMSAAPRALFDIRYYLRKYPHLLKSRENPLIHYIAHGQKDGNSLHPLFDIAEYCEQVSEKELAGMDPISHYVVEGSARGIRPHQLFDSRYYSDQINPHDQSALTMVEHYIEVGAKKQISPHRLFDCAYYLAQYGVDRPSREDDLLSDYLIDGKHKNPHPLFDSDYYLSQIADHLPADQSPLTHYVKVGRGKNLSPHPGFDIKYYLKNNSELEKFSGDGPIVHYIYSGSQKERWPHPEIEKIAYKPTVDLVLIADGDELTSLSGVIVSVLSQLYPRWRMAVVNGSSDTSDRRNTIRRLAEKDTRITVINADARSSFSLLANKGIRALSGEYIVFLNSRLFLKADALLAFVKRLNQNSELALIHSAPSVNDGEMASIYRLCPFSESATVRFFIGPLALYRRRVIEDLGGFEAWHQGASDHRFLSSFIKIASPDKIRCVNRALHYTRYRDPLAFKSIT